MEKALSLSSRQETTLLENYAFAVMYNTVIAHLYQILFKATLLLSEKTTVVLVEMHRFLYSDISPDFLLIRYWIGV